MATVIGNNQVKLSSGKVVQASTGGWYDGQQFWNGTLSNPGEINAQSNQIGAGQAVSREVIAQTNPANVAYIDKLRQQAGLTPSPTVTNPQPQSTAVPRAMESSSTGATGAIPGIAAPEPINLPKLYETLYASSGIRDIESQLAEKTNQYNAQVSKIKDNPYLSEATMSGRLKKIEDRFLADTQNIKNDIAMRKADVETRLNLASRQFDINNQQAQTELSRFNFLLSSGALDNATGDDIANITRATGIPISVVQSAVQSNKIKNYQTSVQSYDDGSTQGVKILTVDPSGNIVNVSTQSLGPSTKTTSGSLLGSGTFDTSLNSGWEIVDTSSTKKEPISSGWNQLSSGGPSFTPAKGSRTIYTDPVTGQRYQFANGKWVKI